MVKIFGYSDDLVEIEGSNYKHKEIDCFGRDVKIYFDDGTVIKIGFYHSWEINIVKVGTADFKLTSCKLLQENDPDAYSDIFVIDAEISKHQKL